MPCMYGKKAQILGTFGWTDDVICTNQDILRKMPPGRQGKCMFYIDQTACSKYRPVPALPPHVPPTP